jgi:hypothetical protein
MNRSKLFAVALAVAVVGAVPASAGMYIDGGIGVGGAGTSLKYQSYDFIKELKDASGVDEVAVEVGIKAGFGPIAGLPLYVVGDFSGIGHRFYDSYNYAQFNSYLIGPGAVYYPIESVQVAASVGYSFAAVATDVNGLEFDGSGGFAYSLSGAYEWKGLLVGLKLFGASNKVDMESVKFDMGSTFFGVFLRYVVKKD